MIQSNNGLHDERRVLRKRAPERQRACIETNNDPDFEPESEEDSNPKTGKGFQI